MCQRRRYGDLRVLADGHRGRCAQGRLGRPGTDSMRTRPLRRERTQTKPEVNNRELTAATVRGLRSLANASRFAIKSTPTPSVVSHHNGTVVTGTTPRFVANARQTARPTPTPRGMPTPIPTSATVVACQQKAEPTWLLTNPIARNSPVSRRRRTTLTTSTCTSVAAPKATRAKPKMRGKFTA